MIEPQRQPGQDLGFGDMLSEQRNHRLVNRDGTFNVLRGGSRGISDFVGYAAMLHMSWITFLSWICFVFLLINSVFGLGFLLLGPGSLALSGPDPAVERAWRCFFFSVHTFTTIGYGNVLPVGLAANLLVVTEAFVGFLSYSLATGLLFARFTRPIARIRFSKVGVVNRAGDPGLFIRLTNLSRSELIQIEATVVASFFDHTSAHSRCYYPLVLERNSISFMPLSWTIAHYINEKSPFYNLDSDAFVKSGGELLVQVKAIDQASFQAIYARVSFAGQEVVWDAKYADIYSRDPATGLLTIDLEGFDSVISLIDRSVSTRSEPEQQAKIRDHARM